MERDSPARGGNRSSGPHSAASVPPTTHGRQRQDRPHDGRRALRPQGERGAITAAVRHDACRASNSRWVTVCLGSRSRPPILICRRLRARLTADSPAP